MNKFSKVLVRPFTSIGAAYIKMFSESSERRKLEVEISRRYDDESVDTGGWMVLR